MSILIKGMDMPKTGCYILSVDNTGKDKTIFTIAEHTHSGKIIPRYVGEAVPVPPHGRLIDAEKIYDAVEQRYRISSGIEHRCERDILDLICAAPTIIEAEEGET